MKFECAIHLLQQSQPFCTAHLNLSGKQQLQSRNVWHFVVCGETETNNPRMKPHKKTERHCKTIL